MPDLLGAAGTAALRDLLRERTVFAFDFDGTLAPLKRHTVETELRTKTRALWAELETRVPCAVISGRGVEDLKRRMAGATRTLLVGNHGMELSWQRAQSGSWRRRVGDWVQWLAPRVGALEGVVLEPKTLSLSLHWRGAANGAGLTRKVRRLAGALEGARLIFGKQVVNVVPAGAPNKGDALVALMRHLRVRHSLFAGDDVTDEDGFAVGLRGGVLGVRVGVGRRTAASFHLRSQLEIDALLERLLALTESHPRAKGGG